MQCDVANLVLFKRLLGQIDGFDPYEPVMVEDVESVGGSRRLVSVTVRDWSGPDAAVNRAVDLVTSVSNSMMDGSAAEPIHWERIYA